MSESLPLAGELATVFARMSGLLLSEESAVSSLRLITSLARETLPSAMGAGVTLVDSTGHKTSAAASDPVVEQADDMQYQLDQGPCLTAWAERRVVRIDDMESDGRWPEWAAFARGLGMGAALSAPMVAGDSALGAIKVYAAQPGVFDGHDDHVLSLFAAQAAILVANMQAYEAAQRLSAEMKDALRSRDVIGMAKGVFIGRDGADEATAFASLVGLARQRQGSLRQTAEATLADALRRRPSR